MTPKALSSSILYDSSVDTVIVSPINTPILNRTSRELPSSTQKFQVWYPQIHQSTSAHTWLHTLKSHGAVYHLECVRQTMGQWVWGSKENRSIGKDAKVHKTKQLPFHRLSSSSTRAKTFFIFSNHGPHHFSDSERDKPAPLRKHKDNSCDNVSSRISWDRGNHLFLPAGLQSPFHCQEQWPRMAHLWSLVPQSQLCFSHAKAVSCQIPDHNFLVSYQLSLQTHMEKQGPKLQEKTHLHSPDNTVSEAVIGKPSRALKFPLEKPTGLSNPDAIPYAKWDR